ncbi:MAG: hypothetical protein ACK50A_17635 [Sphingobacteriaceae bacterium]|jgi:hypothetical protein
MKQFKEHILQKCKELVDEKLNKLFYALDELNESAEAESKSTAGDKHETGRAMIQLEQEKIGKQIQEWEIQKQILEKIDLCKDSNRIALGTLIETDKGLFFLAVNLGRIKIKEQEVMVISTQSPLGKLMMSHQLNEALNYLNTSYCIKDFY